MIKTLSNYKGETITGTQFDLYSGEEKEITLWKRKEGLSRVLVCTGVQPKLPEGYGLLVQGSAGLCHTAGIMLMSPFTLNCDYSGELKVVLINMGNKTFTIYPGNKIGEATIIRLGRFR